MRKIWSGQISFGLVSIPVGLAASKRDEGGFKTLHRGCNLPIKQKRTCPTHDVIEWNDVVKGYEIAKGRFIPIDPAELSALAPESSRSITVLEVFPSEQIDPLLIERSYYLLPEKDLTGERAYALFLGALERNGLAAVVRFNLWGKENLAFVSVQGKALVMHLLYYAEDMISPVLIEETMEGVEVTKAEEDLADKLVTSLASDTFEHADYDSGYRARLKEFLAAKVAGEPVVLPEAEVPEAHSLDLVEALTASLDAAGAKSRKPAAKKPAKARKKVGT